MSLEPTIDIKRSVAIEIAPTGATLIEVRSDDALEIATVRGSTVAFAAPLALAAPDAAVQLADALRPLVVKYSIQEQPISLLLSGEYCSTRVLNGDDDAIRRGMQELEKLKHHYMGLGRGEKATASVVHSIDARQERATIAVAIDSTLELLIEASQRLGVELETVEPTAIGLARLAGYVEVDREQPVALLSADQGGTDLVLAYQGELILHHRLGAPLEAEGEIERVRRQLCLLAQHAMRFSETARTNDLPVYVVTSGSAEERLIEGLTEDVDIEPRRFALEAVLPSWQRETDDAAIAPWAAIGGCLRPYIGQRAAPAPDMVHNLTGTAHLKLMQARRRMIFPLVAAGVVGIAVGLAAYWESSAAAGLAENLRRFDSVKQELELAKMQLARSKQFNTSTEAIRSQVSGIDWRRELDLLAQCKPAGVWLKRVTLRPDGSLAITGVGENDAAIYEFKDLLKTAPSFEHVEVISTRAGQRTEFEIECDIRGRGGY